MDFTFSLKRRKQRKALGCSLRAVFENEVRRISRRPTGGRWELHLRNDSCVGMRPRPPTSDQDPGPATTLLTSTRSDRRPARSDDDDDNDVYLLARVGRRGRKKGLARSFIPFAARLDDGCNASAHHHQIVIISH